MALPLIERKVVEASYNGGRTLDGPVPGSIEETGENQAIYIRGKRQENQEIQWFWIEGSVPVNAKYLTVQITESKAHKLDVSQIKMSSVGQIEHPSEKSLILNLYKTGSVEEPAWLMPNLVEKITHFDCVILEDGRTFLPTGSRNEQWDLARTLGLSIVAPLKHEQ